VDLTPDEKIYVEAARAWHDTSTTFIVGDRDQHRRHWVALFAGQRTFRAAIGVAYWAGREATARDIEAAPWADEGPYARDAAKIARGEP
jgi:uncharacterized glyoxalase superfamily protein PhnB